MAVDSFELCHPWVLAHEGGYVNHPKDPGGATNQGVTQRTYNAWRRNQGLPLQDVREISAGERDAIYRGQYWNAIRGDDLPRGVDYAVYDFAVNSGPTRAAKYLQSVAGVAQDGVIGNVTLAAVAAMPAANVIKALCKSRMAFLKRLKHWPTFKNGWTRRVMGSQDGYQAHDSGVIDRAISMRDAVDQALMSPPLLDDGSGAKGGGAEAMTATVKDAVKSPAAIVTAVSAAAPAVVSASQGDGPLPWAISAVLVIAAIGAVFWLVRSRS